MAKRKAAVVQTELERALRAFMSATGKPPALELLPGGGARIVPAPDGPASPALMLSDALNGAENQTEPADVARRPRILL